MIAGSDGELPSVLTAGVRLASRLNGWEFDDPNTADAAMLAEVAGLLGFRVTYDEHGTPVKIEAT